MSIYNQNCIIGASEHIRDESMHLLICDPPFGINESTFDKHYKRDESHVIQGYAEAPTDYYKFSVDWITQAKRVMAPDGSMYIVSGWSKLRELLNAVHDVGLHTINHIVWKFNFGVATKTKFVSSHYHVLYLVKNPKVKPTFNTFCRFGSQEKVGHRSSLFQDLEDVFVINKDYAHGKQKNKNKLPDELIRKLILYSSKPGDTVCDFFLGNFTTAKNAKLLGREAWGFELNPNAYSHQMKEMEKLQFGGDLAELKQVVNIEPENKGKPITDVESASVWDDYNRELSSGKSKKDISALLCDKYKRGRFAIKNILDKRRI